MGYLEFEPWFLPRLPADFFSHGSFFPAGFFWPPSDSSSCVNCRLALSLVLRFILRSCNRLWYHVLLLLLVLGLNCQNKPNGFASCFALRGVAEIEFFLTIIYLVFVQMLPLLSYIVFDKFFLRFLPVIESWFVFIWQMTLTKKTFQSMQRRSHEFNVAQANFNAVFYKCQNSYYCADGKRSMFHSSMLPWKTQRKLYGAIKWQKLKEKTAFELLNFLSRTF